MKYRNWSISNTDLRKNKAIKINMFEEQQHTFSGKGKTEKPPSQTADVLLLCLSVLTIPPLP